MSTRRLLFCLLAYDFMFAWVALYASPGHTEGIEQLATKEFVRQELRAELEPIQRDIKWLRWSATLLTAVMLGGFTLLIAVMFHLDSKTDKRFDKIETEQKEQRRLLLQILQKR